MNETLTSVLVILAGGVLGAIFFGGLWWTVGKGLSSAQPALWFFGSMLLRTSVVLTGFYFICSAHCGLFLFCLLGFALAAPAVTWLTRVPVVQRFDKVVDHAHQP